MLDNDYDYDNDNEPPRDFCTAPLAWSGWVAVWLVFSFCTITKANQTPAPVGLFLSGNRL